MLPLWDMHKKCMSRTDDNGKSAGYIRLQQHQIHAQRWHFQETGRARTLLSESVSLEPRETLYLLSTRQDE